METDTDVEMETMMSALTEETQPPNRPTEEEEQEEEVRKLQESISMFKLLFVCVKNDILNRKSERKASPA